MGFDKVKILVCVKQVPDAEAPIGIAGDGRSLAVSAGDWRMNRFDEFAVEEALRIRESAPGSVVEAVSVGPARAVAVLRRALAMGADEAFHILREEVEDPLPGDVAAWIAAAVRGRGHDLILTGVMSEDAMHAQTGPVLAELLGIPCATAVIAVRLCPENGVLREENKASLRNARLRSAGRRFVRSRASSASNGNWKAGSGRPWRCPFPR